MARADVASASAQSDSIKGLAQSIANPAYRRLLTAEPLLRRAVPVLIIAFLVTICVGALVQVLDQRRQTLDTMALSLDAVADVAAERLHQPLEERRDAVERPQELLAQALPSWATGAGRRFLLTNEHGVVTAAIPATDATVGRRLIDLLGPTQPLTTFGADAGVMEITLPDDSRALATVRMLKAPFGQIAVVQPRDAALGVLALAHHAHHHAVGHHRLRRADPRLRLPLAGDARARSRPDLRNGAHPHRHRAQPRPLRPVGLGPGARPHLLVAVDVRHSRPQGQGRPADLRRRQRAGASRRRPALRSGDRPRRSAHHHHRSRLPHAPRRRPLGLAARALRTGAPGRRSGPASDRHRGRRHRAEEPGRKDGRRRHAPARRHRDHPGSLRAVGCRQPAGAVQFQFPGAAQPARRGDRRRRVLRSRGRGRLQAGGAQQGRHRRPEPCPARGPSKRSSRTAAGCTSANAAPRTAAMSRSAPTSPRSRRTKKSWSTAKSG